MGDSRPKNTQHNLAAKFTSQGVTVRGENVLWKIALCGYGYGVVLKPPKTVAQEQNLIGLNTTAVD